jgi:hypothetical protein
VHESIDGGQISVSTLEASSSSSSEDHRVDNTFIEHTSFGGPAPSQNNDTVKSHAEQMIAHRRVRIKSSSFSSFFPFFFFFFFFGLISFFLQLRQIVASSQLRGGSRTSKNIMVEDRPDGPKVC